MFARTASVTLALVACTPPAPEHIVMHSPSLATLHLRVASGTALALAYDAISDQWIVAAPAAYAVVTAARPATIASPDAFAHAVAPGASIARRETLSDGFLVTLDSNGELTTYVLKELGSTWIVCNGAVTLCKALKRRY